jgi:hypothetical protein
VDNVAFRLMKNNTPGNYTFILKGTKEVPRRLLQEKRKTIGMRVPSNPIAQALLETLGEPMLSREGHRGGTWVLMDFGSLVVHVFTAEARKFYDLERLWQDGHQVNLAAVLGENA